VDDEVLAGLAALVGVVLAGEEERLLDAGAVDLDDRVVLVLLDDREQVAEQAALERGERRAPGLGGVLLGVLDAVDRLAPRRQAAVPPGAASPFPFPFPL
jgi:hypothetical protein